MRALILHKTIFRELLTPFLFSTIGFTVMALMVACFQLSQHGMPAVFLADFLPCLAPSILVMTLPMACLFATTLTYSRLAADQEIQAAQWSGVRLATCAAPAILLGAFASLGCAVLNDRVVPLANARIRELKERAARELPLILAATSQPTYGTDTQKVYINAFEGNVFSGVTVMETVNSMTTRIMNARQALVHYDAEAKTLQFDLVDGNVDVFDAGPPRHVSDQGSFALYHYPIAFDPALSLWNDWKTATRAEIQQALKRRVSEGSVSSGTPTYAVSGSVLYLGGYRGDEATDVALLEIQPDGTWHAYRSARAALSFDLEQGRLQLAMGPGKDQRIEAPAPPLKVLSETPYESRAAALLLDAGTLGLTAEPRLTSERIRTILRERVLEAQHVWYEAKVELQERMSLALAALCFTAVGVPLGVWLKHGNRLVSFGASLVAVFCLYVPAMVAGKELSLSGQLPAPVGLWLPNAVMTAAGILLARRIRY